MPLARYFFFVGGVLLALLFIVGSVLPQLPTVVGTDIGTGKPFVRISSERKWPERVVFDTSTPSIASVPIATTEQAVPTPSPEPVAEVSAKARDAFAQLQLTDQKKPESKSHRKRRIAKKKFAPPAVLVAQQPRFGFFGNSIW